MDFILRVVGIVQNILSFCHVQNFTGRQSLKETGGDICTVYAVSLQWLTEAAQCQCCHCDKYISSWLCVEEVITFVCSVQLAALQRLELENQDAAKQLEDVVAQGEKLLVEVQQALHDIAQTQLQSQTLETSVTVSSALASSSSRDE